MNGLSCQANTPLHQLGRLPMHANACMCSLHIASTNYLLLFIRYLLLCSFGTFVLARKVENKIYPRPNSSPGKDSDHHRMTMSLAPELILRSSWQATAAIPALAGILSHHVIFRPYEIDGAGWELVFTYLGLSVTLCIAYVQIAGFNISEGLLRTFLVVNSYNVSLAASILTYRAFFHRLRRFPGPFSARLSRFYAFHKATKTVRGCEDIQKLHAKYGDFVRVGKDH